MDPCRKHGARAPPPMPPPIDRRVGGGWPSLSYGTLMDASRSRRPQLPLWVPLRWDRRSLHHLKHLALPLTTNAYSWLMLLPQTDALVRKTAWMGATSARRSCTRRRCNALRRGTISAFAVTTTSTEKAGVMSHAVATSSSALAQHAMEKDVSALFV